MNNQTEKRKITACAFIYHNGKLLITKRAKTKSFMPNKYELPGGHIEFGERLEDGLIRELQEELHIDIAVGDIYFAWSSMYEDNHYIEVDYFSTMKNPKQKIRLNPGDHSDYRWITEKEIGTYFAKGDDEKVAVKKGFEKLKVLRIKSLY